MSDPPNEAIGCEVFGGVEVAECILNAPLDETSSDKSKEDEAQDPEYSFCGLDGDGLFEEMDGRWRDEELDAEDVVSCVLVLVSMLRVVWGCGIHWPGFLGVHFGCIDLRLHRSERLCGTDVRQEIPMIDCIYAGISKMVA